jgi:hypothetical protein
MTVEDRLIKLEILTEEKWAAHDKNSAEHWQSIKTILDELRNDVRFSSNRVMELPCKERLATAREREKTLDEKFRNRDIASGASWAILLAMLAAALNNWIHGK